MTLQLPHLIDTHCHLDFGAFESDRQAVVRRAEQANVIAIINPGIDLQTSRQAIQLAQQYPLVYAAVGVHPNEASQWQPQTLDELRQLCSRPKVVAIGEIGLDYYRDRTPRAEQIRIFEAQLDLAAELQLPVIIHNRDASQDVMDILTGWVHHLSSRKAVLADRPGVLHSFSAEPAVAEKAVLLNFKIGITGPITYPNAKRLQALVASLSLRHLLIETDAPFLSPQPQRGKRNEPGFVRFTAEKIAELHRLDLSTVAAETSRNAQCLFKIGEKSFA